MGSFWRVGHFGAARMTGKVPLLVLLAGNPTEVCAAAEVENGSCVCSRMTCEISLDSACYQSGIMEN
jgi:hypothetical protein